MEDEFEFEESRIDEAFHIEIDLYETGDYSNLLVIPCNDTFIVVSGNEHLCTLIHTCKEVECWEQQDGNLDEEIIERIGLAIEGFTSTQ
jgi:hypothetical protein